MAQMLIHCTFQRLMLINRLPEMHGHAFPEIYTKIFRLISPLKQSFIFFCARLLAKGQYTVLRGLFAIRPHFLMDNALCTMIHTPWRGGTFVANNRGERSVTYGGMIMHNA